MDSITKNTLENDEISEIVKKHFDANIVECMELTDGYYNLSYKITMDNGKEVVLKVAPPQDVKVLTYEKDIMQSEIHFFQLIEEKTDVSIPHIYDYQLVESSIGSPYYFMSKFEGVTLNKVEGVTEEQRRNVYEDLARDMACMHNIKGEAFGYLTMMDSCGGKNALESLLVAVKALYEDARNNNDTIPIDYEEIEAIYRDAEKAFNGIDEPCLVHFDLWDGNIFVDGTEELSYVGIIDFERGFYGCPAADLAHIQEHLDLEKEAWFLEIYNQYADNKVVMDLPMQIRMLSYKLYLCLIMYVESEYRDVDGSFQDQKNWIIDILPKVKDGMKMLVEKIK